MSESGAPSPSRILYIDDDLGLGRLVQRHLARQGFEVVCAESGEAGLQLMNQSQFDVVALDHHMPGIGGLETLTRICSTPTHLPVIYVTGAEDSRLAVSALKAGASDYVIKADAHVFFELLQEAVRQAIERVESQRRKEQADLEIRLANERLEALVARQDVMMREVNHRVANSLMMMSSLVRMQTTAATNEDVRNALIDTQNRIEAIIQVHRRLYTSPDVEVVELGQYLSGLVGELQHSLGATERHVTLEADVQEAPVPTDTAVSIGVIVAELITNAFKYAFQDRPDGRILVSLKRGDAGDLTIAVADNGVGIIDGDAKGTGLGSTVVRAMSRSVGAEVVTDTGATGTTVSLSIAAPEVSEEPAEGLPPAARRA
ncbi:Two-component sensor histidine kinase, contains HisKA and HATPase domains [Faunimonas pinastri]|uniref:histidine kinase n=1 Tax=Faunimonas pinastri TaxID=1855383 RepID=A0A1H9A3Y3_9HYPH|nr:response regulator [Faunimonas pinastri]SEP71442.1 Two-component sensor histidine kinase, contains HisKA and HATPase domains [Faunimonas pinastri]